MATSSSERPRRNGQITLGVGVAITIVGSLFLPWGTRQNGVSINGSSGDGVLFSGMALAALMGLSGSNPVQVVPVLLAGAIGAGAAWDLINLQTVFGGPSTAGPGLPVTILGSLILSVGASIQMGGFRLPHRVQHR